MIYVGYWLIFKKKFDRAGEIFRRQMEEAVREEDDEVKMMMIVVES